MPSFLIVLKVHDGLSLGSILMTKDVELVKIEQLPELKELIKTVKTKQIPVKIIEDKKEIRRFHHSSGKTADQLILELFNNENTIQLQTMKSLLKDSGFAEGTASGVINKLKKRGAITKIPDRPGYQLKRS